MDEYIKREYAVDAVLDVYYDTPDIDLSGEKFEAAILKIQAADVAPVRHGRWIAPFLSDGGNMCAECSNCHKIRIFDDYCSACGAIMDLNDLED